jgi:hypothetical protein
MDTFARYKVSHMEIDCEEQKAPKMTKQIPPSLGVVDFQSGGGILGIHRSDRLLQMMRRIDRVIVELCSIWPGRFSLTIPRIESICGLENFDLTEMLW